MVHLTLACIHQLSTYLNVSQGKVKITDEVPTRNKDQKTQKGFVNIILQLIKESPNGNKLGKLSSFEEILIYQWLEYCITYVVHLNTHQNIHQVLTELNEMLALKTYLVSNSQSIADVVLYYLLLNVMQNLSAAEKESYLNVCRWFDNIQQDESVKQSNKTVNFTSNYIVN